MTIELEQQWKQPCFASLDEGVRLHYDGRKAWLHTHFAHALFYTSKALPVAASSETLKLETARDVVRFNRAFAEQALTANGFVTRWTDEQCDGIAREIANLLSVHPSVRKAVLHRLEQERDEIANNRALTHGDETSSSAKCMFHKSTNCLVNINAKLTSKS